MYGIARSDWRWAVGHLDAATINASDSYLIENEPIQPDQPTSRPWLAPSDSLTRYPHPARVTSMMDGTRVADGFIVGEFGFSYLTEGQMAYLDTKFGWSDTVWSAEATIKVRRQTGVFVVIQCLLHRPMPNEDYHIGIRGMEDVVFRYTNGVFV
jgi:hypothetical protein